jgi:hypothetical protein
MPDISMCINEDCPMKLTCYRYTATPTPLRQSYMSFKWDDTGCDHFWPNVAGVRPAALESTHSE